MIGLGTVNSMIDLIKKAKDASDSLHDAELTKQIAKLMNLASKVEIELANANTKIASLTEKLKAVQQKQDLRGKLKVGPLGGLYLTGDYQPYAAGDGPFCEVCFSTKESLVKLSPAVTRYKCPCCGSVTPKTGDEPIRLSDKQREMDRKGFR